MPNMNTRKTEQMNNDSTPLQCDSSNGEQPLKHTERRVISIFGYTNRELTDILRHFRSQLPEFVKMSTVTVNLVTRIILTGQHNAIELLHFKMNKYQQMLVSLFSEELVTTENKSIAEVLGNLLRERELTVSCAESCTGGNIAHQITMIAGSSVYFLGSVVSYSNEVKADVLGVQRNSLARFGAVSQMVAEEMARGVARLMKTDCAIATTGIAGPEGGTKFKPVGTVWIAVHYHGQTVSELIHFKGSRTEVIESATNHAMFMLIRMLRNSYTIQDDINDD